MKVITFNVDTEYDCVRLAEDFVEHALKHGARSCTYVMNIMEGAAPAAPSIELHDSLLTEKTEPWKGV